MNKSHTYATITTLSIFVVVLIAWIIALVIHVNELTDKNMELINENQTLRLDTDEIQAAVRRALDINNHQIAETEYFLAITQQAVE